MDQFVPRTATAKIRCKILLNTKNNNNQTKKDYLKERETPLLVVYPLKLDPVDSETGSKFKEHFGSDPVPVFGFAIGFPKKEEKVMVRYRINKVKLDELNNGMEFGDEEEDESDDD